jgi:signal transduction histidine kinase
VWIPVHSTFSDLDREPHTTIATDMFRVMQELLTNVARHAGASEVQVSLSSDASGLQLVVQDDGHGFDTRQTTRGFGLMGVRERVRHHAGDFELESSATGTRVRVRMQSVTTS